MSTRGFIGYKKDNKVKGWYNHFDSYYSDLGVRVLEKYMETYKPQLEDFFLNRVEFIEVDEKDEYYQNHKEVMDLDWKTDNIKLQDATDFLFDGTFCEYGYVFNLDDDTLEVYRGFFDKPQRGMKYPPFVDKETDPYFTHKVLVVSEDNAIVTKALFEKEDTFTQVSKKYKYWEKHVLTDLENAVSYLNFS